MQKPIPRKPSCEDELSIALLSVADARIKILASIDSTPSVEEVSLNDAIGRVLGKHLLAQVDVPAYNNSAMDGYALNSKDFPAEGTQKLKIVGIAYAGKPYSGKVNKGQAIRIMTGAILPDECDSVVMQELVECEGDVLRLGPGKKGQNARHAGEDLKKGSLALKAGKLLTSADIGLIASVGNKKVSLYRRLRVAIFSTGDELRTLGEELEPGQIYDSNRYTLRNMLSRLGMHVIDLGVVRDSREETEAAFIAASEQADVLLTSGGVSVGDADFVTATLDKLGQTHFWKIAMKPGRPLAFGHINKTPFFGLPGNPVSVMVTFAQFVAPALLKMSGALNIPLPITLKARLIGKIRKRPGRMEYQRAKFEQLADGEFSVESVGNQGSGILRSMSEANCFIVLDIAETTAYQGDTVTIQPFPHYL